MILHPITSRREALNKLKIFWATTRGSDYLRHLNGLRRDTPKTHKSSEALDLEIEWVQSVHQLFIRWTNTSNAAALRKNFKKLKSSPAAM